MVQSYSTVRVCCGVLQWLVFLEEGAHSEPLRWWGQVAGLDRCLGAALGPAPLHGSCRHCVKGFILKYLVNSS